MNDLLFGRFPVSGLTLFVPGVILPIWKSKIVAQAIRASGPPLLS